MSTKKILVIEDNQKHLADAKAFFADKPEYHVTYVINGQEAIDETWGDRAKRYDYVITDLFMPLSEGFPLEQPIGLGIFMMCKEQGVRCLINTAGYHHGQKYQWICSLPGVMLRDCWSGDNDAESDVKDWAGCLDGLTRTTLRNGRKWYV